MVNKAKVLLPIIGIILMVLLSGCTTQKPVKDLSPGDVVTTYWNDIARAIIIAPMTLHIMRTRTLRSRCG